MRLPAGIGHLILEEEGQSESWAAKQELSGSSQAIRQNRNFMPPYWVPETTLAYFCGHPRDFRLNNYS